MILSNIPFTILTINALAEEQDAIRLDKGSPSPVLPYKFKTNYLKDLGYSIAGNINKYPLENKALKQYIIHIEQKISKRMVHEDEIVMTNGAMSGIFYILASLFSKNTTVLLNNLSFEGFSISIDQLGLNKVIVNLEDVATVEYIVKKKNVACILFNTPENPSGKMYSESTLKSIGKIAEKYNITVICDEVNNQNVYQPFTYISPASYINKEHLITVNSFSKNYFLSGIRLGWTIGSAKKMELIRNAIRNNQIGISSLQQLFAATIVEEIQTDLQKLKLDYAGTKKLVESSLHQLQIEYLNPVTAGYVFFINCKQDADILSQKLLNKHRIAVVPGSVFGKQWKNWIRIGFAAATAEELKKSIPLIKKEIS